MSTDTRAPVSERESGHRPGRRPALAPIRIAAVALVVGWGLGSALSADLPAKPSPFDGVELADAAVARLAETQARAVNDEDVEALRGTFTDDARFTDLAMDRSIRGADSIALFYGQLRDMQLRLTSDVVDLGGLYAASYTPGPPNGGVVLFSVRDGKVADLVLLPYER